MKAEKSGPATGNRTIHNAPTLNGSVTQPNDNRKPLTGCPRGCSAGFHECGVGTPLVFVDPVPCTGRCSEAGVDDKSYWSRRHGTCPCGLEVAS